MRMKIEWETIVPETAAPSAERLIDKFGESRLDGAVGYRGGSAAGTTLTR
jgi:hypothetical protein